MLGLSTGISQAAANLRSYVKENLKLYLDFKSSKADTLKFPCEGSTSFDGSDDYISIGSPTNLDNVFADGGTVSAWIYPVGWGESNAGRIASKSASGNVSGWNFYVQSSGRLGFIVDWDTTDLQFETANSTLASLNTWYHVAVTYNSSSAAGTDPKLYINGIHITSYAVSTDSAGNYVTDASSNLQIGNRGSGTDREFDGKIANVGIWSRVLSLEEIQSIMRKNYSQLKGTEKTSLVSWWALDDTLTSADGGEKFVVDSVDTTSTEIITNQVDRDFSSSSNWVAQNANISVVTSGGQLIIENNSAAANRAELTTSYLDPDLNAGKVYKLEIDVASKTGTWDVYDDTLSVQLKRIPGTGITTAYNTATTGANRYLVIRDGDSSASNAITLNSISLKEYNGNVGVINGATVTTSVYGGNAPVLDRAVDVAKEGQADAIGDGSALFVDSNTDSINMGDVLDQTTNAYSITAWIKTDGSGDFADNVIVSKRDGSSVGYKFFLESSTNKVRLFAYDGSKD